MVYLSGITMDYESCVTVTMQVLELLLERDWKLSSRYNLNECYIRLNDEGFVEEEKQRFNGSFSYGVEKVAVSPLFILRMLFYGDEGKMDMVTSFAREVPEDKFNGAISYVELVKMLEAMRNSYCCNGGKVEDINYFKFRKKYKNWKRDSYLSIKNQVLSISGMKYEDLVNLYNEKKKYYGFNEKWFIFGELDQLTFGMMSRINGRIAQNADIRRIPLHSFRHSCASLLINTGQPVTTVSKYLGHASTKETLDTYAHMFPNNLGDVKNTIDNLNLGI